MAEIKNNFVKSRMNKDLDARLVPPGEYRDAINVAISKSDGEAVGALENILGNVSLTDFGITDVDNIDIIGTYMDVVNDRIIIFMTNYIDTSADYLSNFAPLDSLHYIGVYNINTQVSTLVVSGNFLNFSKTHNIYGVNLIEDLLFWTDNRNQPRKINIKTALGNPVSSPSPYYTTEDHISVAKYYPYKPIDLFKKEIVNWAMLYIGAPWANLYVLADNVPTAGGSGSGLTVNITGLFPDGTINTIEINNPGVGYLDGDVVSIEGNNGVDSVSVATITLEVEIISTMQDVVSEYLPNGRTLNPLRQPYGTGTSTWQGDTEYLKDKFVRFSYRFKFDDGEYSLIAPFTQECFVPQQDGYFIYKNNALDGGGLSDPKNIMDEDATFKSTEVGFMQNKINNIILILNSPIAGGWDQVENGLKVTEIDILYKQSDQSSIRVADTIDVATFSAESTDFLEYNYQSRKPWKTLPTSEVLRVYDQVPVRALAQEVSGNRVIYGNYIDKHTPPTKLNYALNATDKFDESAITTDLSGQPRATRKEYQNHTLKRNRTYQIGVILADRYGRQSTVILSELDVPVDLEYLKGSTLFHPFWDYNGPTSFAAAPSGTLITPSDTWPGDSLQATFYDTITSNKSSITGEPGMYQASQGVNSLTIANPGTLYNDGINVPTIGGTGSGLTVDITTTLGVINDPGGVIINNPGSGYTVGDIVTIFRQASGDGTIEITALNTPNPLGWHSFKMVVKQPKHEYYNVYFPGILNGYIDGDSDNPTSASATEPVVHFALYADNINKIPRDLSLVGPSQVSFRSGRPSPLDDPSYYKFVDSAGNAFNADPLTAEGEKLLKDRDRVRDLDSGSQITNASIKLTPRVQNNNTGVSLSYPGRTSDVVTTIGTGVELGLWDPAAKSPYNTAPVFYGYKTNPYIAKTTVGDYTGRIDNSVNSEFGATGPSSNAGLIRYSMLNIPTPGSEYTAQSFNVRTTPDPAGNGGKGKGILLNIRGIDDAGTYLTEQGDVGGLDLSGTTIANPDDREIVGYDAPSLYSATDSYRYDKTHTVHMGDLTGRANIRIERQNFWGNMAPTLNIYEVEPVESKLDIYWESTTGGLISELNSLISSGDISTPVSFSDGVGYPGWLQYESYNKSATITGPFWPTRQDGTIITGPNHLSSFNITDANGAPRSNDFFIHEYGEFGAHPWAFEIYTDNYFMYGANATTLENFNVTLTFQSPSATYATDGTFTNTTLPFNTNCQLLNVAPSFVTCPANLDPSSGDYPLGYVSYMRNLTYTFEGRNGSFNDILNDPLRREELQFEIVSQTRTYINPYYAAAGITVPSDFASMNPFYIGYDSSGFAELWQNPIFNISTIIDYPQPGINSKWSVTVRVTDGGGMIGECTLPSIVIRYA